MADIKKPKVHVVLVGMGWSAVKIVTPIPISPIQKSLANSPMQRATSSCKISRAKPSPYATRSMMMPYRELCSFLLGDDVGGAGAHWNGMIWRAYDAELQIRNHYEQRYGKRFIPADMTIQDWPMTYAELEPFYDRFEYVCGISATASTLPA